MRRGVEGGREEGGGKGEGREGEGKGEGIEREGPLVLAYTP